MGIVKSLIMSKRQLKKVRTVNLAKQGPWGYCCDEAVILAGKRNKLFSMYRDVHLVLFKNGEPVLKLVTNSDVLNINPSNISIKIDIASRNSSVRLFPRLGKLYVNWEGLALHVTGHNDETV